MLAIAAGLRFYDLGGQSLWSDEGNSVALAGRPLGQIAADTARDIHPPLYYWLLHLWIGAFGTSEFALRSLSALLGVALIVAIAELGRRLYNAVTGLVAAAIATLSAFQVYYSQEARMYMLLALLAALSFLAFVACVSQEDERLPRKPATKATPAPRFSWFSLAGVFLVIIWTAGLYTHYAFPAIIGLTAVLYLAWVLATWRRGVPWRRLLRFGLLLVLAGLFFVPWLPTAYHQLTTWPNAGSAAAPGEILATSFALLGLGTAGKIEPVAWQIWALVALVVIGAWPWRALLSPALKRRFPRSAAGTSSSGGAAPQSAAERSNGFETPAEPAFMPLGTRPTSLDPGHGMAPPAAGVPSAPLAAPAASMPAAAAKAPSHVHQQHSSVGSRLDMSGPPSPSEAWYWLRWFILVTWLLLPICMMLALGLFRDAYLKFLLIASPAFALLLAHAVVGPANAALLWERDREAARGQISVIPWYALSGVIWATVAFLLITAISGNALGRYFGDSRLAHDDYRGISQFLAATSQPDDAILLDAPGQSEVFGYYYRGNLPVYALPRQRPIDTAATVKELDQLTGYNKIYVLYWATDEADPERTIENWMNGRGYKMLDQWRGNVRLAVYMMPEQSTPNEAVDNLNLTLGQGLTLLGYRAWNLTPHAGEVTQLQLVWRGDQTPSRRYKVFLQLLDARDQVIAQRDAEPAGESRPTDQWRPGETILDNHGLLIPPGTPPGIYRRIIGMYDRETLQRLRLPSGEDHIDLQPITVERSPAAPALAALGMQFDQSFDFGGMKLLGHDRYKHDFRHAPNTPLYPGDRLHLTFYWQPNVQPPRRLVVRHDPDR